MFAYVAKEFNILKAEKPVGIIQEKGLILAKIQKARELPFQGGCVGLHLLDGQDLPHVRLAARVTDHTGATANQNYRAMPLPLNVNE
jgi:hypothetical protein